MRAMVSEYRSCSDRCRVGVRNVYPARQRFLALSSR